MSKENWYDVIGVVVVIGISVLANVLGQKSVTASFTKRCAAALVVAGAAQECRETPGCVITMADLERLNDANADRQNYCPKLGPGQEAANQ